MELSHDLYLYNAELEHCSSDKEKIDIIFSYSSLHYILDGHGWFNGVRLGAGQFFLAERNQHACYYADPADPWTYIYFDLYGESPDNAAFIHQFCTDANCGHFTWDNELKDLLQMFLTYTNRHTENRTFMQACADMLLSFHRTKPRRQDVSSKAYRHLVDVKNYIDLYYYQKQSIEEIAEQFHLTRAYIRNLFVRYLDMSPKQYLQNVRMEKASEMLLQTRHDINLIAKSVGYEDLFCFSKAFKRHYGISPSSYRKETENDI